MVLLYSVHVGGVVSTVQGEAESLECYVLEFYDY